MAQNAAVKTVRFTLDKHLVQEVDEIVKKLGTTRSSFAREALRDALSKVEQKKVEQKELERRHREGYEKQPVQPGEFDVWEDEQVWVD